MKLIQNSLNIMTIPVWRKKKPRGAFRPNSPDRRQAETKVAALKIQNPQLAHLYPASAAARHLSTTASGRGFLFHLKLVVYF